MDMCKAALSGVVVLSLTTALWVQGFILESLLDDECLASADCNQAGLTCTISEDRLCDGRLGQSGQVADPEDFEVELTYVPVGPFVDNIWICEGKISVSWSLPSVNTPTPLSYRLQLFADSGFGMMECVWFHISNIQNLSKEVSLHFDCIHSKAPNEVTLILALENQDLNSCDSCKKKVTVEIVEHDSASQCGTTSPPNIASTSTAATNKGVGEVSTTPPTSSDANTPEQNEIDEQVIVIVIALACVVTAFISALLCVRAWGTCRSGTNHDSDGFQGNDTTGESVVVYDNVSAPQ